MGSPSVVVAVVALLSSAVLMLGDQMALPPLEVLKRQWAVRQGYDLVDLSSPVLSGKPLEALAFVSRLPVFGRILCSQLAKVNKILEVRKYVATCTLHHNERRVVDTLTSTLWVLSSCQIRSVHS